jgi:hypothetical protein
MVMTAILKKFLFMVTLLSVRGYMGPKDTAIEDLKRQVLGSKELGKQPSRPVKDCDSGSLQL